MRCIHVLLTVAASVCLTCIPARAEFAIRDGDTVVFLGDSITAARQYSKIIEQYTLLRFPDRKVRFVNAGKGGETMKLALDRLDEAVFGNGATIVTVAYGVNDIGWGAKADAEHRKQYLDATAELLDRCRARGVRVFLCSAAITSEDPDKAEQGFLQTMCDDGLALAKSKGVGAIDVQRSMREVQRRVLAANAKSAKGSALATMHAPDGVHLNDLGQMAMAWAILKGLGAPADVSSATIDASKANVVNATNCQLTAINAGADGSLTFTRLDERLPLNLAPLWMLHGMFIPISEDLNRYTLAIQNLPPTGRYAISAGGRPLGAWGAAELARGVNLASATADPWVPGGPWDAQGHALKVFTDMRDEIAAARRGMNANLSMHPHLEDLRERTETIEREIVELQRQMAKPIPVEFTVRPLKQ